MTTSKLWLCRKEIEINETYFKKRSSEDNPAKKQMLLCKTRA